MRTGRVVLVGGLVTAVVVVVGLASATPTPANKKPPSSSTRIKCKLAVTQKTTTDRTYKHGTRCAGGDHPPPATDAHSISETTTSVDVPCELGFDIKEPGKGASSFNVDVKGLTNATFRTESHDADGSLGSVSLSAVRRASDGLFFNDEGGNLGGGGGITLVGTLSGTSISYRTEIKNKMCYPEGPGAEHNYENCAAQGIPRDQCYRGACTDHDGKVISTCTPKSDETPVNQKDWSALVNPIPPPMVMVGTQTPVPGLQASFAMSSKALIDGITSGKPFSVTGTGYMRIVSGDTTITSNSTVTIEVGDVPYEAIIAAGGPDDTAARDRYKKWIPEGPDLKKFRGGQKDLPGNTIPVVAYLRDKKTKKLITGLSYHVEFALSSSHQQGLVMNFPAVDSADNNLDADLSFEESANGNKVTIKPDPDSKNPKRGKFLTTLDAQTVALATITSWDYGGYASVSAKIVLPNGTKIDATYDAPDGSSRDGMAVPLDENRNHVADYWEDQKGVLGKNLPATADRDDSPSGMTNTGDGFTLYEEYRGFVVDTGSGKLEQLRTDPTMKDLFIRVSGSHTAEMKEGVDMFGTITGLAIHYVPDDVAYLAPSAGDVNAKYPRWLDFNGTPEDHVHYGPKQGAVNVTDAIVGFKQNGTGEDAPANTPFIPEVPDNNGKTAAYGVPMDIAAVRVFPINCTNIIKTWTDFVEGTAADLAYPKPEQKVKIKAALIHYGLDGRRLAASARALRTTLQSRLITFVTLHELGHAIGARHHNMEAYFAGTMDQEHAFGGGVETCPMRYWHYTPDTRYDWEVAFLAERFRPEQGPLTGGRWKLCSENWPTMRLHQKKSERYSGTASDGD